MDPTVIDAARRVAAAAAARAGVRIRPLTSIEEFLALDDLFVKIWGPRGGNAFVPTEMTQALHYSGNYIVGAFDGNQLVGGSYAFFGRHRGRTHVHSHITGVLPALQSRSVGYAIKLHQRAWTLDAGIDEVIWTFDPLIRRNAYFNLAKLGGRVVAYHAHFYGALMTDAINAGDESDRAVILWSVASPEVEAILAAPPAPGTRLSSEPPGGSADATAILDRGDDDRPSPSPAGIERRPVVRAWVPPDIVATRRSHPELALAWRRALRDTVGRAIASGYQAVAMSRDGWYTLTRPPKDPA